MERVARGIHKSALPTAAPVGGALARSRKNASIVCIPEEGIRTSGGDAEDEFRAGDADGLAVDDERLSAAHHGVVRLSAAQFDGVLRVCCAGSRRRKPNKYSTSHPHYHPCV